MEEEKELKKPASSNLLTNIIIVLLALVSVGLLLLEVLGDLTVEQSRAVELADIIIAFFFLGEYLYRVFKADKKLLYAFSHWYELLASIPITSDMTRAMRSLRVLRVIEIVRIVRAVRLVIRLKFVINITRRFVGDTKIYIVFLVTIASILIGAVFFHYYEADINDNIGNFWDSVWLSTATITTVGYGDIVPITTGGKVIAIILMLAGVGIFGALTALIAKYVIKEKRKLPFVD
ncbi:potassium channel family protein [Patescibacteria group bacterium]